MPLLEIHCLTGYSIQYTVVKSKRRKAKMRQRGWENPTIPEAEKFQTVRRINYAEAGNEYQSLFLSVPKGAARTPTVVFFHGGGMTRDVKKLTTNVPFDARRRRPVFVYNDEPVWYPGFPVSDAFKGGDTAVYYIEKIF